MTESVNTRTRSRFYYGYVIVVTSLLTMVVMHGIGSSYGVFLRPFQSEFGWNRAMISGASSLAFLLGGLFAFVGGRLTDRYGPKLTMILSGLFLGVGYTLVSHISSLWQLYLFFGVIVAVGNSSADVALLPTVARWYIHRRGMMTSIVKSGTGIGIFIVPLVASYLIVTYGWRTAYAVLAIVAAVGVIGLAQFLKRDPSAVGDVPPGPSSRSSHHRPVTTTRLNLGQAMHTRQFWILCSAYFLTWFATQSVMVHIAARSVDTGVSVPQAALVVSAIGGASIFGRLGMGTLGDRIGNRRVLVLSFIILLVSLVWLQFAQGLAMLIPFALLYGFAHGGFFTIPSPLVAELFGVTYLSTILGAFIFIGSVGGAIGPIITGVLFDATQSYRVAFVMLLIVTAIGLSLALMLKPVKAGTQ